MSENMNTLTLRLDGKKILITGVSRSRGIGATLAKRFAEAGAAVAVHGFSEFDLTVGNHLSSTPNGTEILAKGCNDTGYMFGEAYEAVAKNHPAGHWGTPDDTADLALFLHGAYGKWITGQVIASHGGCRGEF